MRRDVLLLSAAAFASAASLRAIDPLLPLIAEQFSTTTGAASAAITTFALSYGLLQVLYGPLGDRYGRYRLVAAASLVSAVASAGCAVAPSLQALVGARLVAGATIGALIPLSLAWIGDSFPYGERQALLARFLVGQMLGLAFGTAFAGWLAEQLGWRAIFVAFAALFLVIAALLALELRRSAVAAQRPPAQPLAASLRRMPGILKSPWVRTVLLAVFAEGFLLYGAFAFVALHFQQHFGLGPGAAGTLVTGFAGGGLLYALAARRAVPRLGEAGLVALGGAAMALGYLGLGTSPFAALATVCVGVVGAGYYMLHTTLQTNATQMAPKQRGSAVALFATSLFLGQAGGVWLAARVVDASGTRPVFFAAALGLALLSVVFRRRLLSARRAR